MMELVELACIAPDELGLSIPMMTYMEVTCHKCHRKWRIPVRKEWTDWKLIAKKQELQFRQVLDKMNAVIKECETEIGPLPSSIRLRDQLLRLREMVERQHEQERKLKEDLDRQDKEG